MFTNSFKLGPNIWRHGSAPSKSGCYIIIIIIILRRNSTAGLRTLLYTTYRGPLLILSIINLKKQVDRDGTMSIVLELKKILMGILYLLCVKNLIIFM